MSGSQSSPHNWGSGKDKTKLSKRLQLLAAVAWMPVAASLVLAHEGHSHAPASAKSLKSPLKGTEAELAAGRVLYERNCVSCHGLDGKARTQAALAMKVKPADLTGQAVHERTEGEIYWVITNGIKGSGMPGLATKNSDLERWEITLYTRQLPEAGKR